VEFQHGRSTRDDAKSGREISTGTFCEIITNRKRSQLRLTAVGDGLLLQGPGRLSQDFLLNASSISLATLLDTAKLSRKMRLLLSYFLAKAVWQFYDSEWMRREWTKSCVHFMLARQPNTSKGIFINEPFLSASFDNRRSHKDEDDQYRSHLYPKILSLGVMLLEIELGVKIEEYRLPEDICPNGEPSVNADHFAANEIFNKTELWEKVDTFSTFRDVVQVCITPDVLAPFIDDVEGLRLGLEKHIVNPLQTLYKAAWGHPDTSNVRAIEITSSAQLPSASSDHDTHSTVSLPAPLCKPPPSTSEVLACDFPCNPNTLQFTTPVLYRSPYDHIQ
jgi:hypothetical protein